MPCRLTREQMLEEPCEEGAEHGIEDSPGIGRRSSSLESMCGAAKVQEVLVQLATRSIA